MSRIRTLQELGRFGAGMLAFLHRHAVPPQSEEAIMALLRRRAEMFLTVMEGAVYANPRNPYRRLLLAAGCEPADLRHLVATRVLEEALRTLQRGGVYLTVRERWRGIVDRPGLALEFTAEDVNNPMVTPHIRSSSGGSTGQPREAPWSFRLFSDWVPHHGFMLAVHGLREAEFAIYQPRACRATSSLTRRSRRSRGGAAARRDQPPRGGDARQPVARCDAFVEPFTSRKRGKGH